MLALAGIILILLLFPLLFPGTYPSELMISFLPYMLVGCISLIIFTFFFLRDSMKRDKTVLLHRYLRALIFLSSGFIFFRYSRQFNHFYIQPLSDTEHLVSGEYVSQPHALKILYANIHKYNTEYASIEKLISDTDPDVLMFVEFADHHYDNLKGFLQSSYPYTNSTTRSKKFVGSMVFSKYPLVNKAFDFPQGMRRYGYFSLSFQGHDIYFYLIHTSSPDSYAHFVMRNDQLTTFVNDFTLHESERHHGDIVAIGDFNITPRSSYYSILSDAFSGTMENATRHLPLLFTWRFKSFPLFRAHIDHLRATPSLAIQQFTSVPMPGSDHKAFLFTIQPE